MGWESCGAWSVKWYSRCEPVAHDGRLYWLWDQDAKSHVYDPKADRWAAVKDPFGQRGVARRASVVMSTGTELVTWGGPGQSDGARLGKKGTWTPIATQRAPSMRSGAVAAWTGTELLVVGGWNSKKASKGGAAWNPATDTWRKLPARDFAVRRTNAIWTGKELWLWDQERRGHAYDPVANRWRDLATLPEERPWSSAMSRCADGAIFVVREDGGSTIEGCVVWRYEPLSDVWEPSAPPPKTPGDDPRLVDCDGRVILGLGESLSEYVPARDAWAKLPAPKLGFGPHLAWLDGELFVFGKEGGKRITLPKAPKTVAPDAAPIVVPDVPEPTWEPGPAVTALALDGGAIVAGYADGSVRRGGKIVRKADDTRVVGMTPDGATWLVGKRLEGKTKLDRGHRRAPRREDAGAPGQDQRRG